MALDPINYSTDEEMFCPVVSPACFSYPFWEEAICDTVIGLDVVPGEKQPRKTDGKKYHHSSWYTKNTHNT